MVKIENKKGDMMINNQKSDKKSEKGCENDWVG